MHGGSTRQDGFALIVVLWAGLLLALMAAGFAAAVRSHLRNAAAKVDMAQAEALADAGLNIAVLDLMKTPRGGSQRFAQDGAPSVCILDTARVVIEVEDEEGKINVNAAGEDLLAALFEGLGANAQDARKYSERIADYRDADSEVRPGGAERDEYLKAGYARGPKNAPFVSIAELDQVLELPPDMAARAKPFLTTAMAHAGVDPAFASKALKKALSREASAFTRNAQDGDTDSIFSDAGIPQEFAIQSSHEAYTVRALAVLPQGSRYMSETSLILRPGQLPLYRYWSRGGELHNAEGAALTGMDPC